MRSNRRAVYEVLDAAGGNEISSEAHRHGVPLKKSQRNRVDELARGGAHQGVAARVSPYPYSGLDEILAAEKPLVLVLDGVTDPQNLGAAVEGRRWGGG